MAAGFRGNGTNFNWLRQSCDISTCDLSPNGNPEKYGRPMKSAILSLTHTLDPWGGVKGQNISSERSHVAYQIKGNGA